MLMATKTAHITLYALLVLMPLSGWLMATTTPVRVPTFIFGLVELPYPLLPDLPTYRVAHVIHVVSAILLSSLIALHVRCRSDSRAVVARPHLRTDLAETARRVPHQLVGYSARTTKIDAASAQYSKPYAGGGRTTPAGPLIVARHSPGPKPARVP